MNSTIEVNNFVLSLLTLQQDGKQAISGPANWTTQYPLLEVATETDVVVDELCKTMLIGKDANLIARWHFFIGSPGNGKSAAIGKLCRILLSKQSCKILDESDVSIENLEPTAIPYALRVFEAENRFASATIVQDASVVRNPFAEDVDPARELITTLEEAWDKGTSLIICTNRGVIEKAYRERYLDQAFNAKPWFKILRQFIENSEVTIHGTLGDNWDFDGRKPIFSKAKVTFSYLDNRSLLLGNSVFDSLIRKAIQEYNWACCSKCDSVLLCPFKANRDWLADDGARDRFLHGLCRAEVLSGQIIVFREALAFLSLLLAGCPRDYPNIHPCEWVNNKVQTGDLFALAMRRIYMSTFASWSRYGLEIETSLSKRQLTSISLLKDLVQGKEYQTISNCLDFVVAGKSPSTDVGVGRLIGMQGIITEIDPWRECLPTEFLEIWDSDSPSMVPNTPPFFTEIERQCIEVWNYLEELIESTPSHQVPMCHWALRRWCSNFLMHFGGLLEGRTAWANELDEFIAIIETLAKDPLARSTQEKRRIRELDRGIEELLAARSGKQEEQDVVPLSESVTLSGRWVADKLRPRIDDSRRTSSLSISVKFQGGEIATLSARAFLWLNRHRNGRLDSRCFPPELLTGIIDARIRAAARGRSAYAFSDDDVELTVRTDSGESFTISRFDGDAHVERK